MIRLSARNSILAFLVCFFMLGASNAAKAQASVVTMNLGSALGSATIGAGQGSVQLVADSGIALTGEVTVSNANPEGITVQASCSVGGAGGGATLFSYTSNANSPNTVQQAVTWTPPASGMYEAECTSTQSGQNAGPPYNSQVMILDVGPGYQGFINPKYVVVGVTYAPPGPQSYVQYTNMTSVGNTTTMSSSFSDQVGFTISVTNQASIPAAQANSSGGVALTYTNSTSITQAQNNSTTVTISKSSTVAYKTPGVANAFSPVDHDYDYIWLWLNPELLYTYGPPSGSSKSALQWEGYAYDPNDPSGTEGPDIFAVQVGCLDGDFSCPSANTILARSWATDVTWPAGQGPGLTSTDIANILLSDPLANSSYTISSPFPSTTPDGRFTQGPYPPNPINYPVGGLNTMYSLVQTDTETVAQGGSYQVSESFGVSEKLSGSFLGFWGTSTTYTETDTLIWNYSWLNSQTTTTTVTNALSITGPPDPPPPYSGPGEFIFWQDNLFGTFMFYPSD
jgi:hypothetical protein